MYHLYNVYIRYIHYNYIVNYLFISYVYIYIYISGQTTIMPKPELRGFWERFLTEPIIWGDLGWGRYNLPRINIFYIHHIFLRIILQKKHEKNDHFPPPPPEPRWDPDHLSKLATRISRCHPQASRIFQINLNGPESRWLVFFCRFLKS